jgi:hypothetical protein
VAYVAFTRARHELICFAPLADKVPESVEKIKSLSGLMHFSFNYSTDAPSSDQLTCNFNNDTATFCIGEPFEYKYTEPSPAKTHKSGLLEKRTKYERKPSEFRDYHA